jgi:16S rRNA (guanine1516-N2)-methyltransferase
MDDLHADFSRMLPRLRANNLQRELLVRAARIRGVDGPLRAVDATAGLGEDALLLAAAGFLVTMYERNAVVAAMLREGLERAREDDRLAEIVGRMELVEGDSIQALSTMKTSPDVVYLDPMFPARQKSGLIKKKFQLLQLLEAPCADEEALLNAAFAADPRRIVIKRPAKGPFLAQKKPEFTYSGSSIRYDCFSVRISNPS